MQNAHRHTWECRAPSHDPIIFDQEVDYQSHSIKEHGVPEAHAGVLSSAARRPVLDKVLECPFGDDFQPPEKVESSTVFASEALQLHVAAHIKEIALLTLQKLPSDLEETPENVDSDQPFEDDIPGFVKLRGSMYSVLDDESLDFGDDAEAANGVSAPREEDVSPSVTGLGLEDKDESGTTELHRAVQAGDVRLVKSLVDGGANLGSRDGGGRTALHYASMGSSNSSDIMALLVSVGANLGDNYGQTALHYAVERGLYADIYTLLGYGADAHCTDNYGLSPCLWAVISGQSHIILDFIRMGVDPNATSGDGKSALAWAAGLGWVNIAELLINSGALSNSPNTYLVPLKEASASGALGIVQMLLEYGADPNDRDRDGWSAIHWAAEEGHLEIVRLLLANGANVNAVSSYGTSPLHCAANGGHVSIVSLLLLERADPLKSTCHGWTALHHAAYMGHDQVVHHLLQDDRIRSSASQQDNHGWSVLHLAVHSRDVPTVVALSSVIAEPRALFDESGLTAEEWLARGPSSHSYKATSNLAFGKSRCCRAATGLRQAAVAGNVLMVKMLLRKHRADVNGTNSGRRAALYYAAKKGTLPILDILLDAGADPNILPIGRKTWEEFISDHDVLLRLERAGYRKHAINTDIEHQIRLVLRAQGQSSAPGRSVSFAPNAYISPMPDPSISPVPDRSIVSVSAPSAPSRPDPPVSSLPTRQLAPPQQTNDNKRKANSVRSRATTFWKRLIG